jgi:hypothetical protein
MRTIVIGAVLLALTRPASAAEAQVIALSCEGTSSTVTLLKPTEADRDSEKPANVSVVVNLNERTVSFSSDHLGSYQARVDELNAGHISFDREWNVSGHRFALMGSLDRLTGSLWAMFEGSTDDAPTFYYLDCKTTSRVF